MTEFSTKILRVLRSPRCFTAVLVLFGLESVWLALSAAYPMVFDENVHFSVIRLYAHQWSPFFPAHATYTEPFGALVRDPSFLYRYLMSFPYRLISAVTGDQTIQIICLRLINILLFGWSLVLFRRLLLKLKMPPAAVNLSALVFILIPVVPLLAAQINYDNLVQPVTAGILLLALSIDDRLRQRRWPIARSLWLLTAGLLGSLVQIEFLPIFAVVSLWLVWRLRRAVVRGKGQRLRTALAKGWRITSWQRKLALTLPLIVAFGLFWQMYGVNVWRYHTPTPICNQVLTDRQCATDANWVRTEQALAHKHAVDINPLRFTAGWAYRLMVSLFYTSSGGASPQARYLSINPLPLLFGGVLLLLGVGLVLTIIYSRTLLKTYDRLSFLVFVTIAYLLALWLRNYHDYLHLGEKVAINGRYVLPVLPLALVIIALAYRQWLLARGNPLKLALLVLLLIIFSQGGGALTYIAVSNDTWYWPNRTVIDANRAAQHVVKPLILAKKPLGSIRNL